MMFTRRHCVSVDECCLSGEGKGEGGDSIQHRSFMCRNAGPLKAIFTQPQILFTDIADKKAGPKPYFLR